MNISAFIAEMRHTCQSSCFQITYCLKELYFFRGIRFEKILPIELNDQESKAFEHKEPQIYVPTYGSEK